MFNLSDHRVVSWEVANGNSTKVSPHKKTNGRGSKVSMFDPHLFRTTLATGPINANNATEEAEEVMKSVADACDAVYWWNTNIAALRKECIKARRAKTRTRKERGNYEELKEQKDATGTSEIH